MADIFPIQEQIDKGAQFTLFGVKVLAQLGMLFGQTANRLANGCAFYRDDFLFVAKATSSARSICS